MARRDGDGGEGGDDAKFQVMVIAPLVMDLVDLYVFDIDSAGGVGSACFVGLPGLHLTGLVGLECLIDSIDWVGLIVEMENHPCHHCP